MTLFTSATTKLAIVVGSIALSAATPAAAATSIDFDGGANGSSIGAFYAGQGITFSNTEFTDNFSLAGSSGPLGIRAPGTFMFGSGNAIVGTFSGLASSIFIRGLDVGAAGVQIDAFDSSNVLIASNNFFGPGIGVGTFADISVTVAGIKSFKLFQPAVGGGDGVLFDNLSFETGAVPEPATWMMMLMGFGLIGAAMRRRRTTAQIKFA